MGHGAGSGDPVELVRQDAGGACAAADVGGTGTVHSAAGTLGPACAELQHPSALGSPDDAAGLGGDEALVVDGQQQEGLDELGLDGGSPDGDEGLIGEDRGAFGDGIDIAGELEVFQVGQELLVEHLPVPEVLDVLGVEVEVLDVLHHLLQTGCNGVATLVGDSTEVQVEVGDAVPVTALEISIAHGELVEVAQHGHVQAFASIHDTFLLFHGGGSSAACNRDLWAPCASVRTARYYTQLYEKAGDKSTHFPVFPGKPSETDKKADWSASRLFLLLIQPSMRFTRRS